MSQLSTAWLEPPVTSIFVPNDQAPVILIEASRDRSSRRLEITETLLKTYIERDFKISSTTSCSGANLKEGQEPLSAHGKRPAPPEIEVLKLLSVTIC
jgi:hypothetical protein